MKLLEKLKNWRSNNNNHGPPQEEQIAQADAMEEIDSTQIDVREKIEKMRKELGV